QVLPALRAGYLPVRPARNRGRRLWHQRAQLGRPWVPVRRDGPSGRDPGAVLYPARRRVPDLVGRRGAAARRYGLRLRHAESARVRPAQAPLPGPGPGISADRVLLLEVLRRHRDLGGRTAERPAGPAERWPG